MILRQQHNFQRCPGEKLSIQISRTTHEGTKDNFAILSNTPIKIILMWKFLHTTTVGCHVIPYCHQFSWPASIRLLHMLLAHGLTCDSKQEPSQIAFEANKLCFLGTSWLKENQIKSNQITDLAMLHKFLFLSTRVLNNTFILNDDLFLNICQRSTRY